MFRAMLMAVVALRGVAGQDSDPDVIRKLLQAGESALAQGKYAEAESAYEQVRKLSPDTAEIYGRLGVVYFQQGKYDQAVPVLQQGLKLKPSLPRADILLAMSLSELGRFTEALPGLQKGFRTTDAEIKRMSGLQLQRAYTGLGRDREAVEVALELNRRYPTDPEILYHTARLFGNFAFLNMRKLASVAPASTWRYQAAGEVYESQGKYDLAIAAYRQVLAGSPGRPGIHLRIGRALLASRQPDSDAQAAAEFEQELQVDPTSANAAYELGEILRRKGELAMARESFERALKHYPDFDEAHIGLGRVLLGLNLPAPALKHLQRAVALSPDNAAGYFHLARAQEAAGNAEEQRKALAAFRRMQAEALKQQQIGVSGFSQQEVTKQEADAAPAR
jgi:tetratricopeptide (TPR) repeat protein